MAEIQEVVNDVKKSFKKLDKKKIFAIACIVVGVIAIIVFLRNKDNDDGSIAYVASGYDGYPTINSQGLTENASSGSGGGGASSVEAGAYYEELMAYQEQLLSEQQRLFDTTLSETQKSYEDAISKQSTDFNKYLSDLESSYEDRLVSQQEQIDDLYYDLTVSKMKANSNAYQFADYDYKQQLLYDNEILGESIGAVKENGKWYDETGSRLFINDYENAAQNLAKSNVAYSSNVDYMAVTQNLLSQGAAGDSAAVAKATTQRAAKIADNSEYSNYAVTYDKNVDYQAAINYAKSTGASQSVIDMLTAQRNAKIKGENLNSDGSKKTATSNGSIKNTKVGDSSGNAYTYKKSSNSNSGSNSGGYSYTKSSGSNSSTSKTTKSSGSTASKPTPKNSNTTYTRTVAKGTSASTKTYKR